MKDAVATMGTILPDDVGGRDAVHVAVISAVAGEKLLPGEHVGFTGDKGARGDLVAETFSTKQNVGIVDPFLSMPVEAGQRFWVYLYPRTITSLHHHWTHPAFAEETDQGAGRREDRGIVSGFWMPLRDYIALRYSEAVVDEYVRRVVQRGADEVAANLLTIIAVDNACTE